MIKESDLKIRIFIILALVIWSVFLVFPLNKKINLGLDLKGGMYVLLRADTSGITAAKISEAMAGAVEKIRNRIDSFGVKETPINIQGDNSILIQIHGMVDREIINRIREVGKLEFKLVEDDKTKFEAALKGDIAAGCELKDFGGAKILLRKEVSLTGSDLSLSLPGFDTYGSPNVRLQFTAQGTQTFAKVTEENVGKRLAIVLDGKVMSAPVIQGAILGGNAEITGDFSVDSARALIAVLNSGALPIPLSVEEERTVGPLLGSDSIKNGMNASFLGAALVFIFMLIYYLLGGVVADVCLVFNLLFIMAALNILKGTLTLPGIAGLILALGMAVDANVLIYERIRDELTLKKPLNIALKNSFDRTFITIFDSNFTTIIAAAFLFIFGTGPIRGFATTLILGIVISMFTAIFIGKTMFVIFLKYKLRNLRMLQFFPASKINFLKPRYICLALSIITIVVGMYGFFAKGNAVYSIDFKGGQVLEYKLTPVPKI